MRPPPLQRPDMALLVRALRDPFSVPSLSGDQCDLLVRTARRAKLLATLHVRLAAGGALAQLSEELARHFEAANALAIYRQRMAVQLLDSLRTPLQDLGCKVVLLKGTAYIAQGLLVSQGRIFADVDIMVPRAYLDESESRLSGCGWETTLSDPYDQHYYRQWSHELPPLAHPRHPLTLDLHHTILPVTSRAVVDTQTLFADAVRIPDSAWHVLSPVDQVIHACVHLYHDSDCADQLRDLVDLHALIEAHCVAPDFWSKLVERAATNPSLGRSLWYALRHSHAWLDTRIPEEVFRALAWLAPLPPLTAFMDHAVSRVLGGPHVDAQSESVAPVWAAAMKIRAMYLRMPLHLLAYHAIRKTFRPRK